MDLIEAFSVSLLAMKFVFFALVVISILRIVFEMQEQNRWFASIQNAPGTTTAEAPWSKLLFNLSQEDFELVGKVKSELLRPSRGKYNFRRGQQPFQEHILERAVRQLNFMRVTEPKPQIIYGSMYALNPSIYCKDKRANKLTMDYIQGAFEEEMARCEEGLISITHRRKEHSGEPCVPVKESMDNAGINRGYFVEVGAGDGEARSPTICLEMEDKWQGLLVEADPRLWSSLRNKRRKASLGLSCVGLAKESYRGKFGLRELTHSKLVQRWDNVFDELTELNCYPLYTYLLAVEKTTVDFLVININGQELDVLKTLPWGDVTINIIATCYGTMRERTELNDYLVERGYQLHRKYYQEGEAFLMFVKGEILS